MTSFCFFVVAPAVGAAGADFTVEEYDG